MWRKYSIAFFNPTKSKDHFRPGQVLQGIPNNGQFGFSMETVDLNRDKVDDLVISAPFENDQGRIYVFNGKSANGNVKCFLNSEHHCLPAFTETASQILTQTGAKWFGKSISARADLDGNGYNDLAVGAPKSEQVFMYRARPSIQLDLTVKLPTAPINFQKLSQNYTCKGDIKKKGYDICVTWRACGEYTGKDVPGKLNSAITVDLDSNMKNGRIFYLNENDSLVRV